MRINGKQTDRRVIRTKKEILNALTQLLEQKSIDEITVKEITDLAGINRGTFYLHYVDKYDLMEKSINQLIMEMREIGSSILTLTKNGDGPDSAREEIVQHLVSLFQYTKDNHRFVKSLTSENSSYSFHHKFNELLKDNLVSGFSSNQRDIPVIYLVSAVSYAVQGVIQTWIQSGMKETPEMMGAYTFEILYRYLMGYIE